MEPKRSCKSQKTKVRGKTLKEPKIYFINTSVEELYQTLKESPRFEDKELYSNLTKIIYKITLNPYSGIKIQEIFDQKNIFLIIILQIYGNIVSK